jgi:hypothetical protein
VGLCLIFEGECCVLIVDGLLPMWHCGEKQTGGDKLDIPFALLIAACG